MKYFNSLTITPHAGRKQTRRSGAWQRLSVDIPSHLSEALALLASEAGCSAAEIARALIRNFLEKNGEEMDENLYKNELERAKFFQKCDEKKADFWRGYWLGLHRGHDEGFDEDKHNARFESDGLFGEGYREGISCYKIGIAFKDCD